MGLLSKLQTYAEEWKEDNVELLHADDKAAIDKIVVVDSQYGLSACFFMRAGGKKFMPLARNCEYGLGETIDIEKAAVLTLKRGVETCERLTVIDLFVVTS